MSGFGQLVSRTYVTASLTQMQEKLTPLWMAENSFCDVEGGERWHGASDLTFVL